MIELTSGRARGAFGPGRLIGLATVFFCLSCLSAPLPAQAATKAKPDPQGVPGIQSIALFASNNQAGASGAVAAAAFDSAIKGRLNASGVYQVTTFSTRLPSIDRAINVDNTLTATDVQSPVTEPAVAGKIARVMATDGFLLDEIDSYREDPTTHAVSITVSGSLFDTNTGAAARTFAVTGVGSPASSDEGAAATMQRAVDSAAAQVATTLGITPPVTKTTQGTTNAHSSSIGTAILAVLAAVMIGVIVHNVGAHGNTGSNANSSSSTSGGGSSSGGSTSTGPPSAPPI